jgi:hypothetical protein
VYLPTSIPFHTMWKLHDFVFRSVEGSPKENFADFFMAFFSVASRKKRIHACRTLKVLVIR